jgi:hypothetical protein
MSGNCEGDVESGGGLMTTPTLFARARESAAVLARAETLLRPTIAKFDPGQKRDDDGKFAKDFGISVYDAIANVGKFLGQPEFGDDSDDLDADVRAAIVEGFTGTFGDLSTSDVAIAVSDGETKISGSVRDGDGNKVGHFVRTVTADETDGISVEHTLLELDRTVQGQGFAERFNQHLFRWYRDSGIERVELTANIDVGGYAWARKGYDWASERDFDKVAQRAFAAIDSLSGEASLADEKYPLRVDLIRQERREEQLAAAEALSERLFAAAEGNAENPTPFEISQVGRWPGAGRDDWWIGKAILMGSSWRGVTSP